jgi:hypothetical protein
MFRNNDNYDSPYEMNYNNPYDNQDLLNPFGESNQQLNRPYHDINLSRATTSKYSPTNILYQISQFEHPTKKRYHVRKVIFNDECSEMKIQDGYLREEKIRHIKRKYQKQQYKIYGVYSLDMIPNPTVGELLQCKSELISTTNNQSGYALF